MEAELAPGEGADGREVAELAQEQRRLFSHPLVAEHVQLAAQTIATLTDELALAQREAGDAKKELKEAKAKLNDLEVELFAGSPDTWFIARSRGQVRDLTEQNQELKGQVDKLESEKLWLRSELDSLRNQLQARSQLEENSNEGDSGSSDSSDSTKGGHSAGEDATPPAAFEVGATITAKPRTGKHKQQVINAVVESRARGKVALRWRCACCPGQDVKSFFERNLQVL